MGLKIKIPVKEIEKENVCDLIEEKLKNDPTNAYTVAGLMIELFGIKEEDINKPFRDWPKKAPTLYSQIRRCLTKLKNDGFVKFKKHGKAWVYWWSIKEYNPTIA